MPITLHSTAIEDLVQQLQMMGNYNSAESVVEDALNVLRDSMMDPNLVQRIRTGLDQANRGEWTVMTNEYLDQLLENARQRARIGESPAAHVCP